MNRIDEIRKLYSTDAGQISISIDDVGLLLDQLTIYQQEVENKTEALDGYLEAMQQQRVDFDACIQRRAQLLEILKGLMDCPYTIDEVSVPKAGIEVNPDQVVGVLSLSYTRRKAAIAAATEKNHE